MGKLCLLHFCLVISVSTYRQIKGDKPDNKFEYIEPDGLVRLSPLNAAQRNWLHEGPDEILEPEPRIIGGRHSWKGEAPYLILIQLNSLQHWCGGSIYNRNTIITAAHCFFESGSHTIELNKFFFVAGEYDINKLDRTEMRRLGVNVTIHPKYDPKGFTNDIAIVNFREPLRYTFTIQPIPISEANKAHKGKLVIGGYGYTIQKKPSSGTNPRGYSTVLKVAEVDLVSKDDCRRMYSEASEVVMVVNDASILCAGGDEKQEVSPDACQGDSGGPGVCLDEKGSKYLCGIVATGVGCGLPGYPGLYTDVSIFNSWIRQTAGPSDIPTRKY